ncbi:unnamed protein product [Microthlaspi erraticum]|uniref:F-box domain-containing protein n=1 Tax=Microthlaspi erraticum TaxID=1685480 RepID=A0A6D2IZ35_9BRAS|nr:unnamed protein product [Microthlaspi erraticum]CAA7035886.1 unnamed protein product [Microthlaspi erraticum]
MKLIRISGFLKLFRKLIKIKPAKKSNHPPRPPSPPPPLSSSFESLPEDIVLTCLALISTSYYPKLSLVSTSFRRLVRSDKLYKVRRQLKTEEECFYLCLKSRTNPTDPCLIWYSLWIKPDNQTLNQCMTDEDKSTGNLLVPVQSSYRTNIPNVRSVRVGSEIYTIHCRNFPPSSAMWVKNELTGERREAPRMMMARREPALMCVLDGKIYVMGGCRADESTHWGEVFDVETQTWEPLPDPGPEVRFSSNKFLAGADGNIYVKNKKKIFVYLVDENKWDVKQSSSERLQHGERLVKGCVIKDVKYAYARKICWWKDKMSDEWRIVKDLNGLDAYFINDAEVGTYGGKLVIFWDSPASSRPYKTKKIWCAVILLDRSLHGEVEGQIEWVDTVATVPMSYSLVKCETFWV